MIQSANKVDTLFLFAIPRTAGKEYFVTSY